MNSPLLNPLIIHDYDPRWPGLFETLRTRLATVLDPMVAAIEHVGSTSVPGLAAKPIIDIDALLKSADEVPAVIARLRSIGYEHRGDLGIVGREAFRTPPGDLPHHLYVCPAGSEEFRRHIRFRDYLRSHPEDAQAYAYLKRDLSARFGDDRDAYTVGKSLFVRQILKCASET